MFEEKHENFKAPVRKLELPPAATKVKMSGSVKKANRNTYHISSIKRVARMFHVVVVQNNGNSMKGTKKCAALAKLFFAN